MVQQSILTESFRNADVSQFSWIVGNSQIGALDPILTARSSSSASPGGIPGGGSDAVGSGALRLTNNNQSQGSFVIYNRPLNAASGLSIEFDLYAYGGNSQGGFAADGISFFLIDGAQSPNTGGAVGRGLGYSLDSATGAAGIVGGYLGIGFDEFGNFSTIEAGAKGTSERPQSIAVRGRQGLNYPLLDSVSLPTGTRIDVPTATSRDAAARRARIDLTAAGLLSVAFDVNGDKTFQPNETLISNLNVTEGIAPGDSPLPSTFKFGFAASTGAFTNFHEINNLQINTFDGPYIPLEPVVSFDSGTRVIKPNGVFEVTARLDRAATETVTIPLNLQGGVEGTDFQISSRTITIAPGQATGSVTFTGLNNSPTVTPKSIEISIGSPTNATKSQQNTLLTVDLTRMSDNDCAIPDFNGDGGVDLPWRSVTTTESAIWLVNGKQVSAADFTGTTGPNWEIVATRDFNADGKTDLLWRNSVTGENAMWLMDGVKVAQAALISSTAPDWKVAGSRDFNSDGKADIFWRNSVTGENAIWLMNDTTVASTVISTAFLTTTTTSWQIADFADFNNDGKADVVWRNSVTGENAIWLIDGTTVIGAQFVATIPDLNWQIIAARDTSGDGKADLIWRNRSTGQNAIWLMNGTAVANAQFLATISDTNWRITDVCDTNADGKADLIWRNFATGENAIWLLDGTAIANAGFIGTIADLNWEMIGARDTSADGKADLIWRNQSTGENAIWLIDDITVADAGFLPTVEDPNWEIRLRPAALAL